MVQWAYHNRVELKIIQPRNPTQIGSTESFIWRFRDECLKELWVLDTANARKIIDTWRRDYNENRFH